MKNIGNSVEGGVKTISRIAYIVGGWLLILLSIMVCAEIVLRKVFNQSLQGVDEYGGYRLEERGVWGKERSSWAAL